MSIKKLCRIAAAFRREVVGKTIEFDVTMALLAKPTDPNLN